MEIKKDYLTSPDNVLETVAKKIHKDREMTFGQRFIKNAVISLFLCALMELIVVIAYFDTDGFKEGEDPMVLLISVTMCVAVLVVFAIRGAYRNAKNGSPYSDAKYDWVSEYLDGMPDSFIQRLEKGKTALHYRNLDLKDDFRKRMKIGIKWYPAYLFIFVLFNSLNALRDDSDILEYLCDVWLVQIIGWGTLYWAIIFALLTGIECMCVHMYKNPRYDDLVTLAESEECDD